jgi:hypothetical protein
MSDEGVHGSARTLVETQCLNLSLGGALFSLPAPIRVGAVQDFMLDVGGHGILVQAEVRRCERNAQGAYEIGVAFVSMDPADEALLRDYLRHQTPSA